MMLQRSVAALTVMLGLTGCTPPGPRLPPERVEALRRFLPHAAASDSPLQSPLSYLVNGDAHGVPVIFVHGTPGSATGWSDYLLEPMAGSRSMALDRPGFGASGPHGAVTSLARQAEAVAALLPTDGRKVVLVGHSLGGAVVAQVAAEHPARVRGLVLLAASLDPGLETLHPLQPLGRVWPLSVMLSRALRNANEELMEFKGELQALEPLLVRIAAPTIIVHGTRDTLVPFANVAYMRDRLLGARCVRQVELAGQNHFLPWNSQAVVRDAVRWAMDADCRNP